VLAYGVAGPARGLTGDAAEARTALSAGMGLGAEDPARVDDRRREGLADRADEVVEELTTLGNDQFIGGAQVIRGWARATGNDGRWPAPRR